MEILEFGHGGTPLLVFPTSMGRYFEYEDRGMISCVGGDYEAGRLHAFCVDSVDAESWYNRKAHPGQKAWRQAQYDAYLLNEVLPLIRHRNGADRVTATGCSFGGYHCLNFALRHPDRVANCVSMGGAFDIGSFVGKYSDDNVYFNCPTRFLPDLNDGWYWERFQRIGWILATGDNDICLDANRQMSDIFRAKSIPHWLDIWGDNTGHDWQWWQAMAQKYF